MFVELGGGWLGDWLAAHADIWIGGLSRCLADSSKGRVVCGAG